MGFTSRKSAARFFATHPKREGGTTTGLQSAMPSTPQVPQFTPSPSPKGTGGFKAPSAPSFDKLTAFLDENKPKKIK